MSQFLPLTESVTPADQAAVAEVVELAWQTGTPVYPIGGGTSLHYGVPPTEPGLGLSLSKLTGVVDYPARDLTITVEAGVTVAQLAKRLASEGQHLPVDVPQAGRATLGGVVATSPSGPRRYRWGTMRDYVIGLRAVDGRGKAFSSGGRVVKNAAGYNLCRLLTGSLGTLGVITQVTLMVKPVPETSALAVCEVSDFDMAERLLSNLVHTQTLTSAIELLVGPAWQDDPVLGPMSTSDVGRLVVGFEGSRAEVQWMIGQLHDEWRRSEVSSPAAISGGRGNRLWDRLREFPAEGSGRDGSAPVLVEIRVMPGAVIDTIRLVLRLDPHCSIQSHAGDGILLVRFSLKPSEVAAMLNDQLRSAVAATGGSMVVLSYPEGSEFSRQTIWGPAAEGLSVMQAIKSQFDPKGILNPGRFIY